MSDFGILQVWKKLERKSQYFKDLGTKLGDQSLLKEAGQLTSYLILPGFVKKNPSF